jgi:hypothetical protein
MSGECSVYEQATMRTNISIVGFEVLIALVMKSSIFWDIMPCNPLKANRRFGGTCRLHLQHRRAINQREAGSKFISLKIELFFSIVTYIMCA